MPRLMRAQQGFLRLLRRQQGRDPNPERSRLATAGPLPRPPLPQAMDAIAADFV
jgi:hypothetical protein